MCTIIMLLVEGFSETGLFRRLPPRVQSRQFRKYKRSEGNIFLKKSSKFSLHVKNAAKNWEKVFDLLDNSI